MKNNNRIYRYLNKVNSLIKSTFINKERKDYIEIFIFTFIMVFKLMYFDQSIRNMPYFNWNTIYMLIISTGTILVLCSWTLLFKRRIRIFLLLILDGICSFIILSDLYFFRYYSDFISVPTLAHSFLLGSVKKSIFEIVKLRDLIYIIDIIAISIFMLILKIFTNIKFTEAFPYKTRFVKAITFMLVGTLLIFVRVEALTDSDVYSWAFERYFFVSNMNILNFHAYDIYEYNKSKKNISKPLVDTKQEEIVAWFDEHNSKNNIKNKFSGIGEDKNLIIIQAEALQQFVINRTVNGQEITPNINKLINRSIYFDNYFYQTAQGNTSDAEFISNTSLMPIENGAVYFKYPTNNYKSIGNSLKDKEYSTFAVHGYKSGFWNRSIIYPQLGYDNFYSMERLTFDERIGLGLGDQSMFNQTLEIIDEVQKPFYSFLVTLSCHHPFNFLDDYEGIDIGEYKDTFIGNYFKSVHYADAALGEFIDNLEEKGYMDDTILAIYGDHFAIDKDHRDELANYLGADLSSEVEWFKTKKVPLIIHFPNDEHVGVVNRVGGQIDLFPTLANIFNIENDYLLGKDLLNDSENEIVFRNGSFTDGKLFYSSFSNKLFELETGEQVDIAEYEEYIDKIRYKLHISDIVIQKDLLPFLTGQIDFEEFEEGIQQSDEKEIVLE